MIVDTWTHSSLSSPTACAQGAWQRVRVIHSMGNQSTPEKLQTGRQTHPSQVPTLLLLPPNTHTPTLTLFPTVTMAVS